MSGRGRETLAAYTSLDGFREALALNKATKEGPQISPQDGVDPLTLPRDQAAEAAAGRMARAMGTQPAVGHGSFPTRSSGWRKGMTYFGTSDGPVSVRALLMQYHESLAPR